MKTEIKMNEEKLKAIAEKFSGKIRKMDGEYSKRTVRAIAKELGVNKDLLSLIYVDNLYGSDLLIIDTWWPEWGGSNFEETYHMAKFISENTERWNNY